MSRPLILPQLSTKGSKSETQMLLRKSSSRKSLQRLSGVRGGSVNSIIR